MAIPHLDSLHTFRLKLTYNNTKGRDTVLSFLRMKMLSESFVHCMLIIMLAVRGQKTDLSAAWLEMTTLTATRLSPTI